MIQKYIIRKQISFGLGALAYRQKFPEKTAEKIYKICVQTLYKIFILSIIMYVRLITTKYEPYRQNSSSFSPLSYNTIRRRQLFTNSCLLCILPFGRLPLSFLFFTFNRFIIFCYTALRRFRRFRNQVKAPRQAPLRCRISCL